MQVDPSFPISSLHLGILCLSCKERVINNNIDRAVATDATFVAMCQVNILDWTDYWLIIISGYPPNLEIRK
jgi:hypothetical protein